VAAPRYDKGQVHNLEEALSAAIRIGFPVMIKASEGGGGKGIRKVQSAEEFPALYSQVCAEVQGSPVFVMALMSGARHLEVQVLADACVFPQTSSLPLNTPPPYLLRSARHTGNLSLEIQCARIVYVSRMLSCAAAAPGWCTTYIRTRRHAHTQCTPMS